MRHLIRHRSVGIWGSHRPYGAAVRQLGRGTPTPKTGEPFSTPPRRGIFAIVAIVAALLALPLGFACSSGDVVVKDVARPVNDGRRGSAPSDVGEGRSCAKPAAMRDATPDVDAGHLLREAMAAAKKVKTVRMEFHRQERLGLLRSLQPEESMIALCRESPFSVLFTWLTPDSELSECLYVEGANNGMVQLHRRHGVFGGEGGVVMFPPAMAVVFQKAKLPITDFGPRRIMAALAQRIAAAHAYGGVSSQYDGRAVVGPADEVCDHLTLHFPNEDAPAAKRVELYLSVTTHLPVMIELWLPNRGTDAADALDARYIFARMEVNPPLTDADFRLRADR